MKKSIIALVILQISTALAMAFGLVEREAIFFVTASLALFMALAPLREGTILFIVSIPLFFALPISESFDSMSNWRILLSILFLKYLIENYEAVSMRMRGVNQESPNQFSAGSDGTGQAGIMNHGSWKEKDGINSIIHYALFLIRQCLHSRLFLVVAVFLGWGLASSLMAPYPFVGIKKALFFINIFLFFPIIHFIIRRDGLSLLLQAIRTMLYIVLAIGFIQLASTFLFPLEHFWRFWAGHVIPLFYGYRLGELLQTSNTWFSYVGDGPPLLRMFSVFPDSHSFAMFLMLGLAVPVYIWLCERMHILHLKNFILHNSFFIIPVVFLALIFSGSRGVWLSAGVVVLLLGVLLGMSGQIRKGVLGMNIKRIIIGFVLFGVLFLPASFISSLSQRAQGGEADSFASLRRAKSITDLDEISNRSRLQIWRAAVDTIGRYPLFGIGLGNFSVALGEDIDAARKGASAHNLYLDVASEIGLPGLIAFLGLMAVFISRFLKNIFFLPSSDNHRVLSTVFLIYFIWVLGYSFFDVVLFNDKVLMLATMLIALIYSTRLSKDPNDKSITKIQNLNNAF